MVAICYWRSCGGSRPLCCRLGLPGQWAPLLLLVEPPRVAGPSAAAGGLQAPRLLMAPRGWQGNSAARGEMVGLEVLVCSPGCWVSSSLQPSA